MKIKYSLTRYTVNITMKTEYTYGIIRNTFSTHIVYCKSNYARAYLVRADRRLKQFYEYDNRI